MNQYQQPQQTKSIISMPNNIQQNYNRIFEGDSQQRPKLEPSDIIAKVNNIDIAINKSFYIRSTTGYFDNFEIEVANADNIELKTIDAHVGVYKVKKGVELNIKHPNIKNSEDIIKAIKSFLYYDIKNHNLYCDMNSEKVHLLGGDKNNRIKALSALICNKITIVLDIANVEIVWYDDRSIMTDVTIVYGKSKTPIKLTVEIPVKGYNVNMIIPDEGPYVFNDRNLYRAISHQLDNVIYKLTKKNNKQKRSK